MAAILSCGHRKQAELERLAHSLWPKGHGFDLGTSKFRQCDRHSKASTSALGFHSTSHTSNCHYECVVASLAGQTIGSEAARVMSVLSTELSSGDEQDVKLPFLTGGMLKGESESFKNDGSSVLGVK